MVVRSWWGIEGTLALIKNHLLSYLGMLKWAPAGPSTSAAIPRAKLQTFGGGITE